MKATSEAEDFVSQRSHMGRSGRTSVQREERSKRTSVSPIAHTEIAAVKKSEFQISLEDYLD